MGVAGSFVQSVNCGARRFEQPTIPEKFVNEEEAELIKSTWESIILHQRSDIFHKVFMKSIRKSQKMNEILALGEYCVRDLSKWPKLNKLADSVKQFFDVIIVRHDFDKLKTSEDAQSLGMRHIAYAQFGFQPHLLDIWALCLIEVIETLRFEDALDRENLSKAWKTFILCIVEEMNEGYRRARAKAGNKGKKSQISTRLLNQYSIPAAPINIQTREKYSSPMY